ncbi:TldD/PmbA family protein [Spirosoma validum]|uniref:TldD/PmbA family protein n=1 Tax=Spirosoma validum TaxID=2771355 RepID=A0A927B6B5_9BACT|nr:TldD/PmbA family protein [Spirosoma validum]MBD2756485.1 TldD/PmbA family protein [Spirosoma validum]
MKRREFVKLSGLGMSASLLPTGLMAGRQISVEDLMNPGMDVAGKKRLADIALNAAKSKGATYADVRIARYLRQYLFTREKKVQNLVNSESYGIGIRVIANGTWGFAATNEMTPESIARCAEEAVDMAKANAEIQLEPVVLAPQKGVGEQTWKTPIQKNAFEIPVKEKIDLLMDVNGAALKNGASFVTSNIFFVNEQKYFASTDGSYIDQDIHRMWPTFTVSAISKQTGRFKSRDALSAPIGMGYEYLSDNPAEKIVIPNGPTVYRYAYNMIEDATAAALQAKEKLTAKSVPAGKYDMILDPSNLGLTIHESVGHPLELDRVLGYEANLAGTSFATLEKLQSKSFQYGSKIVNLRADKVQPNTMGRVGYDDEGVPGKQWDLVKNGILVNFQATRDQVHYLGENESQGCSFAESWDSVQFQRMPNVSLQPGPDKYSIHNMIKDTEKGIYILGRGSSSIDQQRYNFQFSGQLFYEIKDGAIVGMLDDVAYQSNTQEFWNSCARICDKDDYRLFGTFFDGKGQPGQASAVSHGCPTTRFNGVNVINTGRKI